MYQDLKWHFWWEGIKRDVANFVNKYLVCRVVKAEYQKLARVLQPLPITKYKWEDISIDLVMGLPRSAAGNNSI